MKTLIETQCTGEAHSNCHIDHCMVCLNHSWGVVYTCPHCGDTTKRHGKNRKCVSYSTRCGKISKHAPVVVQAYTNHAYSFDLYANLVFCLPIHGATQVLPFIGQHTVVPGVWMSSIPTDRHGHWQCV